VTAAAAVSGGEVDGATLGSREIVFRPGPSLVPGEHRFAFGSAGSVNLVIQTVLWPLVAANAPSRLILEGGTHNAMSPPTPFLAGTFAPLLAQMGPKLAISLARWGFYPAGGGKMIVDVTPAKLVPLTLTERGEVVDVRVFAAVAGGVPGEVARREIETACAILGIEPDLSRVVQADSPGPGNVMWIEVECEAVTMVFTGFGEKRVRAEQVGAETARAARRWLAAGVPVDEHLADQLLVPMALAGGGVFLTSTPSLHTTTNAAIVQRFLDVPVAMVPSGGAVEVRVG
jgi:RNA 3'-terminal phosphate cyclase (ATP)